MTGSPAAAGGRGPTTGEHPIVAATETARAKVNLALHVVGRRSDGYHLLDTIACFPDIGDTIAGGGADRLTLDVHGPFADALRDGDVGANLVMRAARGIAAIVSSDGGRRPGAALTLTKRLPVAAGLGGGSADAAATIRLLCRLWSVAPDDPRVAALALSLGADVPMCLVSRPLRATGIGEVVTPLDAVPPLGIVLANPGVTVSTLEVYARLGRRDGSNASSPPIGDLPVHDAETIIAALARCRNDLEPPAIAIAPPIGATLDALAALPGCRLRRMSGSGATCFALFDDRAKAEAAAVRLGDEHPDWWIAAAALD